MLKSNNFSGRDSVLLVVNSMRELDVKKLMAVYVQSNRESGASRWRWESPERQQELAEQAFYDYLHDVFYPTPGARYAVWVEKDRYVSALRLEPYEDGFLMEGLESAPDCRGRGYASRLVSAVQERIAQPVYSHVDKRNVLSLAVHHACGFRLLRDSAVLIDGTVSSRACTLVWNPRESKNNA